MGRGRLDSAENTGKLARAVNQRPKGDTIITWQADEHSREQPIRVLREPLGDEILLDQERSFVPNYELPAVDMQTVLLFEDMMPRSSSKRGSAG